MAGANTHVLVFAKQGRHERASKARPVNAGVPECVVLAHCSQDSESAVVCVAVLVFRSPVRHA